MIRFIYSWLFCLLLPFIFLRLWRKSRKNPGYGHHWMERLGKIPFRLEQSIWLHAVSMGEMVAAGPLIQTLINRNETLFLTCMTPTGRNEALKWQNKYPQQVFVAYLPYDVPFAIRAVVKKVHPKLLIVMETELWPNLFYLVKAPIIIANARISDHALPKYRKIRGLMRYLLRPVSMVAAQSEHDAERFKELGAPEVSVMGNIKYDLADPAADLTKAQALQQVWPHRLIITAGSTHEGEETLLLESYQHLKAQFPELLLILVPRHPERFDRVAKLCQEYKLKCLRRSANQALTDEDVLLIDAMGELKTFYALSDIVFVGGSLIPLGGHNILEGAIFGKALIVGPYMQNARQIVTEFLKNGALVQVAQPKDIHHGLENLLQNQEQRRVLGQNAAEMIEKNRGSLARLMQMIDTLL